MLVLAPHPDDEVFGCGGLLALAARSGAEMRVAVVTDGQARGDAEVRRRESAEAARRLGTPAPEFWGFADRGLEPDDPELRSRIGGAVLETRPEVVLIPSPAEIHPDHRALALAVYEELRSGPVEVPATLRLAAYEVSAVLRPNLLVDVTEVWDEVMAAAASFASQLGPTPYIEAMEGIASARRLTLPREVRRAEAYHVVDMGYVEAHEALEWAAEQGPTAGLAGETGEIQRLREEAERLQAILDRIYASRTWKLHRLVESLRGRSRRR